MIDDTQSRQLHEKILSHHGNHEAYIPRAIPHDQNSTTNPGQIRSCGERKQPRSLERRTMAMVPNLSTYLLEVLFGIKSES